MPKLPEQQKTSTLEVLDKKSYNTGEITFPKVPRHKIVFKHHFKLAVILFVVVLVLGLIYVAVKPMLGKQPKEDAVTMSELDKFKTPNETNLKYPNLEYSLSIVIDKVDPEKKLIWGKTKYGENKEYVVRVLDKTHIQKNPGVDRPVVFSSDSASLVNLSELELGTEISVVAAEDPKVETYLNATLIVIN